VAVVQPDQAAIVTQADPLEIKVATTVKTAAMQAVIKADRVAVVVAIVAVPMGIFLTKTVVVVAVVAAAPILEQLLQLTATTAVMLQILQVSTTGVRMAVQMVNKDSALYGIG
jgi:hypothetical protein